METIKAFPEYAIDENGRVFGYVRKSYLKPIEDRGGYLAVYLYRERRRHFCTIHRLVAEQFIPNPQNKRTVNHKDGNKHNNSVENLEWATDSENVRHAFRTGLSKPRRGANNHFFGMKHTKETRAKMSAAKKGKPSPRRMPCVIDGVRYESVSEAIEKTKLCTRAIYRKLKEVA